jgi:hypothetical protein
MFRKVLAISLALPLFSIGISVAEAASSPWSENFESMQTYTGTDFDGNTTELVSDQPEGVGFTSGQAIKLNNQGVAWAGTKFILPATSSAISNANATASISVYSPDALDRCFMLKLEGVGAAIERKVHVSQGWQTLNITYAADYDQTKNYNVIALMPNFASVGCGNFSAGKELTTWYVDNISFPGARDAAEVIVPEERSNPQVLINFESDDSSGYSITDFGGNSSSVVTDAPEGGSIDSTKALKVVTSSPGWSGTTLIKKSRKASLISAGAMGVKANIYSPVAGKILMIKLESLVHPSQIVEVRQTSVAGWKRYTFDFTVGGNLEQDYPMASIYFDFDSQNKTADPWYVDDITFNGAVGAPIVGGDNDGGGGGGTIDLGSYTAPSTLLTFESDDELGALTAAEANEGHPEGVFGGGAGMIVDSPKDSNHGNALAITKSGEQWTGVNAIVDLSGSIRYTDDVNTKVSFNFYSPKGNSPTAVQLFQGDGMVELIQYAPRGWSTMNFDFATAPGWSANNAYDKLVIFPDFQVPVSTPADIYYIDDVAVNGATTVSITPTSVKPRATKAAVITAKKLKVGSVISAGRGTWTGSAGISYKVSWYRCLAKGTVATAAKPSAANKCVAIANQKSSSYKLTKADKGKYIRVLITATNSAGTTLSLSKSTTGKVS